jgi:uncharacterized membrane protein
VRTNRVEAFSDGVFAIAATLLIIDVSVDVHGRSLGDALLHAWPQYAAYAVSFLTIGVMWVNHHTTIDLLARCDRVFLFLNLGLLLCIAFVPFPTRLLAEHLRTSDGRAAALAYGITLTVTAVFFQATWRYAAARLLDESADPKVVAGITRSYTPGPFIYAAATAAAFASPWLSAGLYAAIAVLYMVESSVFAGRRELSSRSAE